MKISHSLKQDVSSEWNSPQTVDIKNKTNERKECQKQNIFNNKLKSDQKANTNTSAKCSQSKTRCFQNSPQTKSKTKQMKESNVKNKTYLTRKIRLIS